MLLMLLDWLLSLNKGFGVFNYVSFRAIASVMTSLVLTLSLGGCVINQLKKLQIGQAVRTDGPVTHLAKQGTPTMGGVLLLLAFALSSLLWCDLTNKYVWLVVISTLSFGAIGFVDDFLKVSKKNSRGLASRWKYFWQSIGALGIAIFLYLNVESANQTTLFVPFLKNVNFNLGVFSILLTYLVIVGASNAVNLTDGLDGLAIMPTIMVASALAIFCYVVGNAHFSNYLLFPFIAGTEELVIICGSLVGAGLGFSWFNTYPAEIFMGDVGSLALGAALAVIAVIARQELVLFIMGLVFVAETLSVILQVGSYKLRGGKRIFLMAPLHHHFEVKGWSEPKIIVRFWIVTLICVLIGLSALKVR